MWSQTCEYAIRAVTFLAANETERPIMAKDIAAVMGIPPTYLQKVMRELVRADILTSGRGIKGGFRLKRAAREIRLIDVISPFDDRLRMTNCPFGNLRCGQGNPCPVHHRWAPVMQTYRDFLDSTSLEDLIADKRSNSKYLTPLQMPKK